MYSVSNIFLEYIYFYISKKIISYTFLLVFKSPSVFPKDLTKNNTESFKKLNNLDDLLQGLSSSILVSDHPFSAYPRFSEKLTCRAKFQEWT